LGRVDEDFFWFQPLWDFAFDFLLILGIWGWQQQTATSLVMLTSKFKFRNRVFSNGFLKLVNMSMMPHISGGAFATAFATFLAPRGSLL
jgi:hypothetical protein